MTTLGGRLATPQILATTDLTLLYTTPTDYSGIINVSLTNRTTNAVQFRMATTSGTTPELGDYIEWDTTIGPRGVFERTQIVLQPNRKIFVSVDTINAVAATTYGLLTPINVSTEGVDEILVEQGSAGVPSNPNLFTAGEGDLISITTVTSASSTLDFVTQGAQAEFENFGGLDMLLTRAGGTATVTVLVPYVLGQDLGDGTFAYRYEMNDYPGDFSWDSAEIV